MHRSNDCLLMTHGIGTFLPEVIAPPYVIDFRQFDLETRIRKSLNNPPDTQLIFESLVWTNETHEYRQNELLKERQRSCVRNPISEGGFKLAINNLSDASASL